MSGDDNPLLILLVGLIWIVIIAGFTWASLNCVLDQSAVNEKKERSHEPNMSEMQRKVIRYGNSTTETTGR
jgi:uncharacterized protein YxeA